MRKHETQSCSESCVFSFSNPILYTALHNCVLSTLWQCLPQLLTINNNNNNNKITDRTGRHEVLLPINRNITKICDIIGYLLNQNTRNSTFCFASSEKKKSHLSARVMARTVQLLGMTRTVLLKCPIKAEIRAVDSQSDLKILL